MIGIILAVVIASLLLLLIGVPFPTILTYGAMLLCALIVLALLMIFMFFACTLFSMPFFQKKEGRFLRFEHAEHFDRAVYEAEGEEYICLFPAENVGRKRIYTDKPHRILVHRTAKRKTAYDRHSLLIITVGTVFSAGSIFGLVYFLMKMFR